MPRKDAFWAGGKPALARESNPAYTEGMIQEGDQGHSSERNRVPLYKRVGLVVALGSGHGMYLINQH
ncbi:MAG: hypothetical protein ABSB32_04365 [Thermodesulfobacteriota bacterium]|jgi:hypothetical protein